jgi:hypothetical protein
LVITRQRADTVRASFREQRPGERDLSVSQRKVGREVQNLPAVDQTISQSYTGVHGIILWNFCLEGAAPGTDRPNRLLFKVEFDLAHEAIELKPA